MITRPKILVGKALQGASLTPRRPLPVNSLQVQKAPVIASGPAPVTKHSWVARYREKL